jgi:hypothetical protein
MITSCAKVECVVAVLMLVIERNRHGIETEVRDPSTGYRLQKLNPEFIGVSDDEMRDQFLNLARDRYPTAFPMRPCRWGMGGHPSNRLEAAFGGDLGVVDPSDGKRCEEIMAKTSGR